VIRSIFLSDITNIAERKQVVIVNNFPANRDIVDSIVGQFSDESNFSCCVIHRQVTMPGIDSWFSAIAEYAKEDEVIFLLGDDDLMLPWGLRERYREIVDHQADMLLSDYADRIYFFEAGRKYWMPSSLPLEAHQDKFAHQWEFWPAVHPEASFMSNHCYRNTANFRKGLELAFAWCDSQSWLKRDIRTGMLPFYLPYAITIVDGRVISLKSKCVIRGAVADEAIKSSYADGGNTAFYNLCAVDVLENRDLPLYEERLAAVSAHFKPAVIGGFMTMILDNKISLKTVMMTFRHSGLRLTEVVCINALRGVITTFIKVLGLRGARLRLRRRSKSLLNTEQIFCSKSESF
jgi:hypothetical protein